MKPQELNLESEVFDEFRTNLSAAINIVVNQMISRRMESGTVSAKIGIKIHKVTNSETGEIHIMPEFAPVINMKIGAKDNLKLATQAGMILKQSGCGKNFVGSNQVSIDELMKDAEG